MYLIKKLSKYIPYIFYISIMTLSNVIIIKNFLFYQYQKQIENLNQMHYNKIKNLESNITNLESNITNLEISINKQPIKNLEISKETQKQTNINEKQLTLIKN
ncbi:hypothetical protein C6B37_02385 [Candidatus Phytoplasma phoenicium]|uniref:Uncharacterized protein n=1 Tax=Candidatus Phytoplasma phoenicium TaxID=198422 RepID=A0A2S8NTJ3_9MOLU|nr:hypothetical protein C6B37_02385 [Candidatus Phytoplasma phoenicium]